MLLYLLYPIARLLAAGTTTEFPRIRTWARVNAEEWAHLRVGDTFDGAVIYRIEYDKEQTTK